MSEFSQQNIKTRKIFSPIALFVLTAAFFTIWFFVFVPKDDRLRVTYLDVGQGDGALISFPDGKTALIDGGPGKKVLEGLGRNIPFYKRKIDIVFLTHPHADHVSGLVHTIERYEVGRVVVTRAVHSTPEYREFLELVKKKKIPVTEGIRGTEFDFSAGNKVRVLYPQNPVDSQNLNNTSEVMMLSAGGTKFLFMGDLEKDGSDKLIALEPDLKADVLKVPHHGSQNALSDGLYKKVSPRYAVISAGEDNRYGHPHAEVVRFLETAGIKYFRTDKDGDVKFETEDGKITKK